MPSATSSQVEQCIAASCRSICAACAVFVPMSCVSRVFSFTSRSMRYLRYISDQHSVNTNENPVSADSVILANHGSSGGSSSMGAADRLELRTPVRSRAGRVFPPTPRSVHPSSVRSYPPLPSLPIACRPGRASFWSQRLVQSPMCQIPSSRSCG